MNETQRLAEASFSDAFARADALRKRGVTHVTRTFDQYGSTAQVRYSHSMATALAIAEELKPARGEVTTLSGKLIARF